MSMIRLILAIAAIMTLVKVHAAPETESEYNRKNVITVSSGYGGTITPLSSNFDKGSQRTGVDWMIRYDRMRSPQTGFGVLYSGYRASGKYLNLHNDLYINYIGPQFIGRTYRKYKRLEDFVHFGIGLFMATDYASGGKVGTVTVPNYSKTYYGIGFNWGCGVEYKLNDAISITGQLSNVFGFINHHLDTNGVKNNNKDKNLLSRVSIDFGIRWAF